MPNKKKKVKNNGTPKKKRHFGDRTLDSKCSGSESYLFNHSVSYVTNMRVMCIYTHEWTHGIGIVIVTKKRKQHPSPGCYASTAEGAPGRIERGEQGDARRAKSTPSGGPHLELGCLRLESWPKSDFSRLLRRQVNISAHAFIAVAQRKLHCFYFYY